MKKNNHLVLIILVLIVMVSLMYINISLKYDKSKEVINKSYIVHNSLVEANNTIDTDTNTEEINLGDYQCETEKVCDAGQSLMDGVCKAPEQYYDRSCHSGVPKSSCRGSWSGGGGSYNLGTCCTTEGPKTRWVEKGAPRVICKACKSDYVLEGTTCVKCKVVKISAENNEKLVSPNSQWCAIAEYNNSKCSGTKKSCTTPESACGKSTITIGGKSVSVSVAGNWEKKPAGVYPKYFKSSTREDADSGRFNDGTPAMEHGDCIVVYDAKDGYKNVCVNVETRGKCGSTAIKSYNYCCVDNEYIGVSDNVIWAEYKLKENTSTFNACEYYYGKGYTYVNATQAQCHKPTPVAERCQYSSTGLKKAEENTNSCEEAKEISISEGEKCSDSDPSKSFYTIKCDRTAKTNFDYGDDNDTSTVREIYKGQGFKFGIKVESTIECRGEFSGSKWINVYNLLKGKLDAVDPNLINYCNNYDYNGWDNYIKNVLKPKKESAKSELYKLWRIIEELKDIVDNYNKYEPNVEYNEEATLDFTYKVGGKVVRLSTQSPNQSVFERSILSEGTYASKYENVVNLGVKGVTNPKNYLRSSKSNPRIVKLTPKNVYINTNTTNIQTDAKNAISGGNKIYIDYATDTPQTITPINITVTGLAGNNSTINNNQCTLKVRDMEIIYRPIDVSNPFINNTWTPGKNWLNSQFDFRNIIHSNIWSTSDYYAKYTNGTWNKLK